MKTTPAQLTTALDIVQHVSRELGVTMHQIESHDRHWTVCWPRFLAIHLVRRSTGWGWRKLGLFFGRNPLAIRNAVIAVANQRACDKQAAEQVSALELQVDSL